MIEVAAKMRVVSFGMSRNTVTIHFATNFSTHMADFTLALKIHLFLIMYVANQPIVKRVWH